MVASVGLIVDIGGIGHSDFEDTFTTLSPNFYFGRVRRSAGQLSALFQPLAVTAQLGQSFALRTAPANVFDWGFAIEYSIPYLQQHVKDIGLPARSRISFRWWEFAMTNDREPRRSEPYHWNNQPSVLWITDYYELGVEANIP